MPPTPPWAVGSTPEPVSLDVDDFVDVTNYVRFEEQLEDIDYGVLDIQLTFRHEGHLFDVYLVHAFALAETYPKNSSVVPGWMDGFSFPPALTKMRAKYNNCWINVMVQQCVAINDRGVSVYGSNKGYRWRLVHHILYHEQELLALFDSKVRAFPRDPIGHPPVTWSWMRPQGVTPREMARKGKALALPSSPLPSGEPQAHQDHRCTFREHRRVDTALYSRVLAMLAQLQDVNRLLAFMPPPVQAQMVPSLTTLHAQLSGLLYTAYLLASIHPRSDDFDIG